MHMAQRIPPLSVTKCVSETVAKKQYRNHNKLAAHLQAPQERYQLMVSS